MVGKDNALEYKGEEVDLTGFVNASSETAAESEIQPCGIFVDEEGDWFYQGNKITREDILALFFENLHPPPEGKFLIDWNRNRCLLDVADTPFVISRADRRQFNDPPGEAVVLSFKHLLDPEILDPSTLYVGEGNVLYCRVRAGLFPARFSRPAYYQLAESIQEDPQSDSFYIELNGKRWTVNG